MAVKDRKGECVGAVGDPDKIFLVQLADFMWNEIKSIEERIDTARHFRVSPGEGVHSEQLAQLVRWLDRLGYRGDYSFEVFNDDYQQMPQPVVAKRARRSAVWLSEDVLHRSVLLPGRMRPRRQASAPWLARWPADCGCRCRCQCNRSHTAPRHRGTLPRPA